MVLILGDNLFHGDSLINQLLKCSQQNQGASVFAYPVSNPKRYGVVEFDKNFTVIGIQEKPQKPKSKYAITVYIFIMIQSLKKQRNLFHRKGELEMQILIKCALKKIC